MGRAGDRDLAIALRSGVGLLACASARSADFRASPGWTGLAFLDAQAVEGFGIIRRPDLLHTLEDAEIDTSAAAGAGFDLQLRMFGAHPVEDVVQIAHVIHPQFALVGGACFRPS